MIPSRCWSLADLGAQLVADARIERRQRLVEQQYGRLDRQRAGDGDPLLLATGELIRVAVTGVAEAHELEQLIGALQPGRLGPAAHPQPERDVLCAPSMFGNRL